MIDRERKRQQRRLSKGDNCGFATSVVMNETQGMSFVNPDAASTANLAKSGTESGISTYFGSKSFNKVAL